MLNADVMEPWLNQVIRDKSKYMECTLRINIDLYDHVRRMLKERMSVRLGRLKGMEITNEVRKQAETELLAAIGELFLSIIGYGR